MANVLLGIHCVVPGCGNTQRKVNQWKGKSCLKPSHKGKSHAQCMCPDPFQFFKFPMEVKLRKIWLDRISRPDLEVNNLTRVCSIHFAEGKPTRRNYFPAKNLRNIQPNTKSETHAHQDEREEQQMPDMMVTDEVEDPAAEDARGGRGGVTVVPLEHLQEQASEVEDEEVPNSRYHTSLPANTITITRVTPKAPSRPVSRPATTTTGNHLQLQVTRVVGGTHGRVGGPTGKAVQQQNALINPLRNPKRIFSQQQAQDDSDNDSDGEYTIMEDAEDDDDDGSSELSDIGIDVQITRKQNSIIPVSSLSLQDGRHNQNQSQDVKPKVLPVYPTVSKIVKNNSFDPVITRVDSAAATISKPNTEQPQATTTSSSTAMENRNNSKESSTTKPESKDEDIEIVYSAIQPKPLATYDPSKQQLQIANPITYILECHNCIAQLLAEKQKLETSNSQLEATVQKLQQENNTLRREVAQASTNKTRPMSQQLRLPPPSLLPQHQGNSQVGNAGTNRRIRYVIRRPTGVFKPNISTVMKN